MGYKAKTMVRITVEVTEKNKIYPDSMTLLQVQHESSHNAVNIVLKIIEQNEVTSGIRLFGDAEVCCVITDISK